MAYYAPNKISQVVTEFPHLNNDEAEMIEEKIALNEASVALRNMKHYKSPSTAGFSTSFLKKNWRKIGMLVVGALNWGFRKGKLSCTQREGIINVFQRETNIEI